jgi:hypothetical protein
MKNLRLPAAGADSLPVSGITLNRGGPVLEKLQNREGLLIGCFAAALAAGILVLTVSAATTTQSAVAEPQLGISESKAEVIAFAGGPPERCVYSGPDREICTWKLEGSLIQPGEVEADPESGVNLVCELPLGAWVEGDSDCAAHGREMPPHLPAVSAAPESVKAFPGVPVAELATALTLGAISHRIGDAPDACLTGPGRQTCSWRVSNATAAREISGSVASIPSGAYQLRCQLPIDGSERAAGSCMVSPLR